MYKEHCKVLETSGSLEKSTQHLLLVESLSHTAGRDLKHYSFSDAI